jgi:hypothetical protein
MLIHLLTSQIMPLPNLHALRTKNIIRSHEMEVEVREREVEHVACFRQHPSFSLLPKPRNQDAKGDLLFPVNFCSPPPVFSTTSASSYLLNSSAYSHVSPNPLFFPLNTPHKRNRGTHINTLQKLNSLCNPLLQLRESLLVILKRDWFHLPDADSYAFRAVGDALDYSPH